MADQSIQEHVNGRDNCTQMLLHTYACSVGLPRQTSDCRTDLKSWSASEILWSC
jgi:hypothetical protein